ncbi:acetylcholine-binding protein [Aplysia californica]|uniref:Acetylcholine-binding protein n=1 Tax=Aplysia californica TaxID=6500 RepID=A0ABM1AA30_APLCA|nr:acetylcholine-binding protein [Aplysia californica]
MAARFLFLCVALTFAGAWANNYRQKYKSMAETVSPAFPQPPDSSPLHLDIRLTQIDIVDVDKEKSLVTLIVRKREYWIIDEMAFDRAALNMSSVTLTSTDIWTPDTTFFNAAGPEHVINREVVLFHKGVFLSVRRIQVPILCDVSEVNTYTGATCHLQAGSFGLGNELIRLMEPRDNWSFLLRSALAGDSDYEVLSGHVVRSQEEYASGDPEQFYYDALTFTFTFRSKYGH